MLSSTLRSSIMYEIDDPIETSQYIYEIEYLEHHNLNKPVEGHTTDVWYVGICTYFRWCQKLQYSCILKRDMISKEKKLIEKVEAEVRKWNKLSTVEKSVTPKANEMTTW
jgi:hypothetical protein